MCRSLLNLKNGCYGLKLQHINQVQIAINFFIYVSNLTRCRELIFKHENILKVDYKLKLLYSEKRGKSLEQTKFIQKNLVSRINCKLNIKFSNKLKLLMCT